MRDHESIPALTEVFQNAAETLEHCEMAFIGDGEHGISYCGMNRSNDGAYL